MNLLFLLTNSCQKSLFHNVLTTIQLNFEKREIKKIKSYASSGIWTCNPWVLRLRNTCAIGCACAKKTVENVFNRQLLKCLTHTINTSSNLSSSKYAEVKCAFKQCDIVVFPRVLISEDFYDQLNLEFKCQWI